MRYRSAVRNHSFIDNPPVLKSGEVVLANCRNSLEDRRSTGKLRPMVITQREDGHVRTVGLTRKPTYRHGASRVAIPNPTELGLHGPGYLWGNRVTLISVLDVERHIGWADQAFVDVVHQNVDLSESDRASLGRPSPMGEVA